MNGMWFDIILETKVVKVSLRSSAEGSIRSAREEYSAVWMFASTD